MDEKQQRIIHEKIAIIASLEKADISYQTELLHRLLSRRTLLSSFLYV